MIRIGALPFFLAGLGFVMSGNAQTLTIIETASTNRAETRVTVPADANSMAKVSGISSGSVRYDAQERKRLWKAVSDAGPLESLPVSHCMKSASFGSSLFVEVDGRRSPDLSCQNQEDARTAALRTEAHRVLQAAAAQQRKP